MRELHVLLLCVVIMAGAAPLFLYGLYHDSHAAAEAGSPATGGVLGLQHLRSSRAAEGDGVNKAVSQELTSLRERIDGFESRVLLALDAAAPPDARGPAVAAAGDVTARLHETEAELQRVSAELARGGAAAVTSAVDEGLRADLAKAQQGRKQAEAELDRLASELDRARQAKSQAVVAAAAAPSGGSGAASALASALMTAQDESVERLRILHDDVITPLSETVRRHSVLPMVASSPKSSTTVRCHEFGGKYARPRFGKGQPDFAANGVCVFERLCVKGDKMEVRWTKEDVDPATYPYHGFGKGDAKSYDWPPCLTCNAKVVAKESATAAELFKDAAGAWVEEPTWLLVHSYQRHTTHFMESVAPMHAAVRRLGAGALHGEAAAKVHVNLLSHGPNLFDWQRGVLEVAARRPVEIGSSSHKKRPGGLACYRKAMVPGYAFELFEDPRSAAEFREDAWKVAEVQQPKQQRLVVYAKRTSKRRCLNREQLLETVRNVPTDGGGAAEVKEVQQGKMGFKEQVGLMARTRLLIGMHGADLTNCMFLPKGSVVIEINPWNWMDERFLRVCETAGVHYLSYNDGGPMRTPFGHYPTIACPLKSKSLVDCKYGKRQVNREKDVTVNLPRFRALVLEAYALLGWGPRVGFPVFPGDFDAAGVHTFKDGKVTRV